MIAMPNLDLVKLGYQLSTIINNKHNNPVRIRRIANNIHNNFCIYLNINSWKMHVMTEIKTISERPKLNYKAYGDSDASRETSKPISLLIPNDATATSSTWISLG